MKIALGTLFPELETAFTNGYTADEHGYIWSTRQGKQRQLCMQGIGSGKSYTSVNKPDGYRRGKAITTSITIRRVDIIDRMAKLMAAGKAPAPAPIPFNPVTLSVSGYTIGSVTLSGLSFSTFPKIHKSLAEVRTETERLAKTNPGKTFVYLEIKGNCTAGGVQWS